MKKFVKVIVAIVAAFAILFSISGCSTSSPVAPQATPTTFTSEPTVEQTRIVEESEITPTIFAGYDGDDWNHLSVIHATRKQVEEKLTWFNQNKKNMSFKEQFEEGWNIAIAIRAMAALANEEYQAADKWVINYGLNLSNPLISHYDETEVINNSDCYSFCDKFYVFITEAQYSETDKDQIVWNVDISDSTNKNIIPDLMFLTGFTQTLIANNGGGDDLPVFVEMAAYLYSGMEEAILQQAQYIAKYGEQADTTIEGNGIKYFITLDTDGSYKGLIVAA